MVGMGVGCERSAGTSSSGSSSFRVAMLLPGSDTDKGWNQMAREGLDRIKGELGAETKVVTNVKSSDFAGQIDYFAADGYDVIICHGGEFEQAVANAVKKYPKVHFLVGGCPTDIPRATAVEFQAQDASHLVGVVAANVTQSNRVAFVGAMAVPTLEACYNGLKSGVESVKEKSGVTVLPALWTDSWDSPQRAKEKTESAVNDGNADVVFQNVDAAARGVFEAVKEANARGKRVFAFGCNSNQNGEAPDVILGSVVIDVPRAYLDLSREAKEGKLQHRHRKLGLQGSYVDLVLNDKHPLVTGEIRQKVDSARQSLLSLAK